MESGGRLSLAVIAVGAAIALAAGGAWWVATAPDLLERPPDVEVAGEVPGDEEVLTPPDESEGGGDPANALPIFDGALERTFQRLDPDTGLAVSIESDKAARYLLQYVCLGPGDLRIRIDGVADGTQLYEVGCAGSFSMFEVTATGETIVVNVFLVGSEPVDVGLQLIPAQ